MFFFKNILFCKQCKQLTHKNNLISNFVYFGRIIFNNFMVFTLIRVTTNFFNSVGQNAKFIFFQFLHSLKNSLEYRHSLKSEYKV